MPMPAYEIRCQTADCGKLAVCKIASRWSDGVTKELKTYFLTCEDCRDESLREAIRKTPLCRLTDGEVLSEPEVFPLVRVRRE